MTFLAIVYVAMGVAGMTVAGVTGAEFTLASMASPGFLAVSVIVFVLLCAPFAATGSKREWKRRKAFEALPKATQLRRKGETWMKGTIGVVAWCLPGPIAAALQPFLGDNSILYALGATTVFLAVALFLFDRRERRLTAIEASRTEPGWRRLAGFSP
jgi:hypothetical protein